MKYALFNNTLTLKDNALCIFHSQLIFYNPKLSETKEIIINTKDFSIIFDSLFNYTLDNKVKTYDVFLLDYDLVSNLVLKNLYEIEQMPRYKDQIRIKAKLISIDTIDKIHSITIVIKSNLRKEVKITIKGILELENYDSLKTTYKDIELNITPDEIIPYDNMLKNEDFFDLTSIKKAEIVSNLINTHNTMLETFNLKLRQFYSIPSLAMKLWKQTLTIKTKQLLETHREKDILVHNFISKTYRGGYMFFSSPSLLEDLYIYDINSLYPAMLKKHSYPIGKPIHYVFSNTTTAWDEFRTTSKNHLGFVKCKITCMEDLVTPFLITKNQEDDIDNIWIIEKEATALNKYYKRKGDSWEDHYTSEEIIYAESLGCYKIILLEGYFFHKRKFLFNKFINKFHRLKESTHDIVEKNFIKLILNTLAGKLGIKKKGSYKMITDSKEKITFNYYNDSYIELASYITAYGRIFMHTTIMEERKKGNIVYYSATDSIFCKNKLSSNLIIKIRKAYYERLGKFKPVLSPNNQVILLSINNYVARKIYKINNTTIYDKEIVTGTYINWLTAQRRLNELNEDKSIISPNPDNDNSTPHIPSIDDILSSFK